MLVGERFCCSIGVRLLINFELQLKCFIAWRRNPLWQFYL